MTNPFDELELDPRLTPAELTAALKRRAERATGEEKERLQALWRELTVNDRDRVRWAFFAHPRPREASPDSIETLREKVPRYLSRARPAPLVPTLADAAVFEGGDHVDAPRPPSILDD